MTLSKSKFLSFIIKVNRNNGNETKATIFPWNIFKSDVILKCFNDFQNQNFSVLSLK